MQPAADSSRPPARRSVAGGCVDNKSINVVTVGAYRATDGYSNVKWLLRHVAGDDRFTLDERCAFVSRAGGSLYGDSRASGPVRLMAAAAMTVKTLISVMRAVGKRATRSNTVFYLPYPSLAPLLFLSFFPASRLPPVAADNFISVYDTVVNDRKLVTRKSRLAKMIYRLEKRALGTADLLVVDTECNKRFIGRLFGIPSARIASLPLFTDEADYQPVEYGAGGREIRVLFAGTFVPLQGSDVVVRAAALLKDRKDVKFRLIGSGQTAAHTQDIVRQEGLEIEWIRDWQPPQRLAAEIARADICLGVFGGTPKAKRVWPYKNYLYMRVGRPVVTGGPACLPERLPVPEIPVVFAPMNDPAALAAKIRQLADNPGLREALAQSSRLFYIDHLANRISLDRLHAEMTTLLNAGTRPRATAD